MEAKEHYF